ncbi:MAG: hypothetical protein II852_12570 [Bacteroidales bacterium]|nr:hypothetical protein [Bacteroidales bacterium]
MKNVITIIAVMLMALSAQGQTLSESAIKIPKLEIRNCSDTITFFGRLFEIIRKDSIQQPLWEKITEKYNEEECRTYHYHYYSDTIVSVISYTVLLGFGYVENENKKYFPVTISGTKESLHEWEINPHYNKYDSTFVYFHTDSENIVLTLTNKNILNILETKYNIPVYLY